MSLLLTLIIPTYNMQDLLARCLDSLILKGEDRYEVLVINDGSKDDSSSIAHSYQERFPGVFRVIDKPNGNYGSCVNRGLSEARGRFVKVLDADDLFSNSDFARFVTALENCDADMVVTNFSFCYAGGRKVTRDLVKGFNTSGVCGTEVFNSYAVKHVSMHALTYKTSMLRSMDYRQTEGVSYSDAEWIFYPTENVRSVQFLGLDLYQYFLGREGQTMEPSVIARSFGSMTTILERMALKYESLASVPDANIRAYMLFNAEEIFLRRTYKLALLIFNDDDYQKNLPLLRHADDVLRLQAPSFYAASNNINIHDRFLPLKFIAYWRMHGRRYSKAVLLVNRFMKYIQEDVLA